jgi:hypothetical protein
MLRFNPGDLWDRGEDVCQMSRRSLYAVPQHHIII